MQSYLTSLFSRMAGEWSISLTGGRGTSDSMVGMQNIITSLHKKSLKEQTSVLRTTQQKKKIQFKFSLRVEQAEPIIKCTNIFDSQKSFDIQAEGEEEVHAIEEAPSSPQTIQ